MDTEITPTQLAIEYLRRDKSNLSPAQYLKKLKQLELSSQICWRSLQMSLKKRFTLPGGWAFTSIDRDSKKRPRQRSFCI